MPCCVGYELVHNQPQEPALDRVQNQRRGRKYEVYLPALKFRTPDGDAKPAEIFRGVDASTLLRNLQSLMYLDGVVRHHGNPSSRASDLLTPPPPPLPRPPPPR